MESLFEIQAVLGQAAAKSFIKHTFQMDERLEQLVVDFSYTPKVIDDAAQIDRIFETEAAAYPEDARGPLMEERSQVAGLTNLLTLNIDDPKGFRGNGHRQPAVQRIVLSEKEATVGFYKGPLPKGLWTITVCTHAIFSAQVDYTLKVTGFGKGADQ